MMARRYKYNHVAVGGTFDRPHIGQLSLIDLAFKIGQKISIGLSQKNIYQDKFLSSTIKNWQTRKKELEDYFKKKGWLWRAFFCPLSDIYGPTISDKTIQAIVVSQQTYHNALKINERRREKGLSPVDIVTAPLVKGDDGQVIAGWRIRLGEINRKGHSYLGVFEGKKTLKLPKRLRQSLRKPLGKVIEDSDEKLEGTAKKLAKIITAKKPTLLITVGDVVSWSFLKAGLIADIQIVDFRIRRERSDLLKPFIKKKALKCTNEAGTVNYQLVKALKKTFRQYVEEGKKNQIIVEGEEDLSALPAILLAPLGSLILYGQYDLGVVLVEVTEEKKREIEQILLQFD